MLNHIISNNIINKYNPGEDDHMFEEIIFEEKKEIDLNNNHNIYTRMEYYDLREYPNLINLFNSYMGR